MKKPKMAGVLGKNPMDTAITEIIMLHNAPNMKLEPGDNKIARHNNRERKQE